MQPMPRRNVFQILGGAFAALFVPKTVRAAEALAPAVSRAVTSDGRPIKVLPQVIDWGTPPDVAPLPLPHGPMPDVDALMETALDIKQKLAKLFCHFGIDPGDAGDQAVGGYPLHAIEAIPFVEISDEDKERIKELMEQHRMTPAQILPVNPKYLDHGYRDMQIDEDVEFLKQVDPHGMGWVVTEKQRATPLTKAVAGCVQSYDPSADDIQQLIDMLRAHPVYAAAIEESVKQMAEQAALVKPLDFTPPDFNFDFEFHFPQPCPVLSPETEPKIVVTSTPREPNPLWQMWQDAIQRGDA